MDRGRRTWARRAHRSRRGFPPTARLRGGGRFPCSCPRTRATSFRPLVAGVADHPPPAGGVQAGLEVVVRRERLADLLGERFGGEARLVALAAQLLDGHVARRPDL